MQESLPGPRSEATPEPASGAASARRYKAPSTGGLTPRRSPGVRSEDAMSLALQDDIQAFRHYIQSERGLAENTRLAYGRDLDRFTRWVAGGGLDNYLAPSLRDLGHYIDFLRAEGL